MKHKNVEVGQHVIIKRSTSEVWDTAASHIGKEFTVCSVEPLSYRGDGTVLVESSDTEVAFWCNHRDLKLVKKKKEETPIRTKGQKFRVTTNTDKYHCFHEGDVVTLCVFSDTASGHRYQRDSDGLKQWLLDAQAEPVAGADLAKPEDQSPEIGALAE